MSIWITLLRVIESTFLSHWIASQNSNSIIAASAIVKGLDKDVMKIKFR